MPDATLIDYFDACVTDGVHVTAAVLGTTYGRGGEAEVREIPESGVPVYITAEVLDAALEPVPEPVRSNNSGSVTCENLRTRTGQDVTLVSDFAVEDGETTVTVHMQNTRLSETTTGNLIVTLQDADGGIVEQQRRPSPSARRALPRGWRTPTLSSTRTTPASPA